MPRGRRGSHEPGPCSRGGRSRPPHRPGAGRRGAPARAPHPSSTPARRRARDGGARRGRERRAPGDGPCRVYPTTRRMSDPRADFLARSERGGIVPVLREVVLDGDTPLAAFVKVARPPFGFLLESVVGGERWARYTFLGTEPREVWRYRAGSRAVERWTKATGWQGAGETEDPIGHLAQRLRALPAAPVPGLPRFTGGAVGYLGYDLVRTVERLSRRPEVRGAIDPLLLYRYLRALNPAPYLFYLALDDVALVGSSPEVLVRVEGSEVTVRPIAGTRPRGRTREEDDALAHELRGDEKERAEHMMLVDLGRNDVGRVARFGSVRVTDLLTIERYSHVQHLVSEVRGQLRDGYDALDVFKACFPAGTVTGAPKVRAMEIIDELEPERRGPYAGAVGYVGWGAANLDTAIAIRCALVRRDRVVVQAGAGIVADSDPAREFRETEDKAQAVLKALALAKAGG